MATILQHKIKQIPGNHNVTHDGELELQSGSKQMDVFLEMEQDGAEESLIVECKGKNEEIGKDLIAAFAFYVDRSDVDRGIFVSKSGYQPGALEIASGEPIQLFEVKEISDRFPKKIEIKHKMTPPESSLKGRFYPPDGGPDSTFVHLYEYVPEDADRRDLELYDSGGNPLDETLEDRINSQNLSRTNFNDGEMVKVDGQFCKMVMAKIRENSGSVEGTRVIDFESDINLLLKDSLLTEETNEEHSEYVSFDEVCRHYLSVDSSERGDSE